ncbi:MAG: carboxylesterase family protein [Segetibacter sp.]
MKKFFILLLPSVLLISIVYAQSGDENTSRVVKTINGSLEGINESGIRTFKGIPFAQPPVGELW